MPPGIPPPELNEECPQAADQWADKVDAACTEVLRLCVAKERASKQRTISKKINNRLVEHILSMEEGGSSSGFLRSLITFRQRFRQAEPRLNPRRCLILLKEM